MNSEREAQITWRWKFGVSTSQRSNCPRGRGNVSERKLYGANILWRINPSVTKGEVTACLFFLQRGLNHFGLIAG